MDILGADVFSIVLDFILDTPTLSTLISVLPPSHRHLALDRRLHLPVLITNDVPSRIHKLLDLLTLGPARSIRVLEIEYFQFGTFHTLRQGDDLLHEYVRVPKRLSSFFNSVPNLRKLSWTDGSDVPEDCIKALCKLERLKTVRLDCPSKYTTGRESWNIQPVLTAIGPNLTTLHLNKLDEQAFTVFESIAHLFVSLTCLTLDITHGSWDWDGAGSPQLGPSDGYSFRPLSGSHRLKKFTLFASDLTMRPVGGPLNLVKPDSLQELHLHVIHCFTWTSIRRIKAFQMSSARQQEFASLTHLSVTDRARKITRFPWIGNRRPTIEGDNIERIYYGVMDFISGLKRLKKLWLDERVLCALADACLVSESGNHVDGEEWQSVAPFHSAEASMESPAWTSLLQSGVLQKLESLRVGLGPLNVETLGTLLGQIRGDQLTEFGFEWDWALGDQAISPGLIRHLQSVVKLKDVHITWPRPCNVGKDMDDEQTLQDVDAIFKGCPSVCRVGIGRCVWERKTSALEYKMDEITGRIQRVDPGFVTDFYDAGPGREDIRFFELAEPVHRVEEHVNDLIVMLGKAREGAAACPSGP